MLIVKCVEWYGDKDMTQEEIIYNKVIEVLSVKYGELNDRVKRVIRSTIIMADTRGDGKKLIIRQSTGERFLVPIEDIILYGIREEELDKYPKVIEV